MRPKRSIVSPTAASARLVTSSRSSAGPKPLDTASLSRPEATTARPVAVTPGLCALGD
jgi:hypothetical protein